MPSGLENILSQSINGSLDQVFETFVHAKSNSSFYKKAFKELNFSRNEFDIDKLKELPFTTKEDVSANNFDFLAVPINEVVEYCTTSGTSGGPITIFLTKSDIQNLALNEARSFNLTGCSSGDVFQLMTTIDKQFMAGLAYWLGVQELGAGIVRIGPGVPAMQWKSIFLYKPTVLIAVPSFIINLIDFAKNNGIDFTSSSVRSIICVGESIREEDFTSNVLARRINELWDVKLYSTYASTEMGAAFTECKEQNGCHINNNLIYIEVLGDDDKEVIDGEEGELVITTLRRMGTPLVRYRTGDIARVYRGKCNCGDNSIRLGPIIGRKNQMIKFKGTTIFPNSIFEILDEIPEITCYKIEISKDFLGNDLITVLLEKKIESSGKMPDIIELCRSRLRVVPHFVFLENDYLRSQVYKSNIRKPEKIVFK